jgi:hypothetical protein
MLTDTGAPEESNVKNTESYGTCGIVMWPCRMPCTDRMPPTGTVCQSVRNTQSPVSSSLQRGVYDFLGGSVLQFDWGLEAANLHGTMHLTATSSFSALSGATCHVLSM